MTYLVCFRQQPLLTVQAHVFHINQETKKTWLSVTESAVPVSFFYDVNRGMYRIISVDGTQVFYYHISYKINLEVLHLIELQSKTKIDNPHKSLTTRLPTFNHHTP